MPIPLLVIAIVAVSTIVLNPKIWKKTKIRWFGKNIVILGPKGVGKTTIHKFLREGKIHKERVATIKDKVKGTIYNLNDLSLTISDGTDVGGANDLIEDWKELYLDCDVCIYVFDVRKVFENEEEHIKLIDQQLFHIRRWNEELKTSKEIFVFGLFLDKIKELNMNSTDQLQDFREQISKTLKKAFLQVNFQKSKFIVGSMKNQENAQSLIQEFLKQRKG